MIELLERGQRGRSPSGSWCISAEGRHFCTGADLRADRSGGPPLPEGAPERPTGSVARMIAGGAQRLVAAVLDCEKPVIAAVGGTAAGIGAHLALASDLVIAAEEARFIEVFVRRGIIPDGGGAYLLPRLVGLHQRQGADVLRRRHACGRRRAADRPRQQGGARRPSSTAAVREWAERLAARPDASPSGLAKRLLNRSLESDRLTAFAEEAAAQELAMTSLDAQEGVASFVERRPTEFKGW